MRVNHPWQVFSGLVAFLLAAWPVAASVGSWQEEVLKEFEPNPDWMVKIDGEHVKAMDEEHVPARFQ